MVILREKKAQNNFEAKQQLDEMAQVEVPGFGNDKYVVISKDLDHPPLHAYIYDQKGKEVCDFIVTERPPKSAGDVKPYRSKAVPEDAAIMISQQAGQSEPLLPKVSRWEYLVALTKTHLQKRFRK
jgi:hypothetical protein